MNKIKGGGSLHGSDLVRDLVSSVGSFLCVKGKLSTTCRCPCLSLDKIYGDALRLNYRQQNLIELSNAFTHRSRVVDMPQT